MGGGDGGSVVSGSSLLHAGGFRFGDVLVVGLVLQFSAEVLDGFIQAFLQGNHRLPAQQHLSFPDVGSPPLWVVLSLRKELDLAPAHCGCVSVCVQGQTQTHKEKDIPLLVTHCRVAGSNKAATRQQQHGSNTVVTRQQHALSQATLPLQRLDMSLTCMILTCLFLTCVILTCVILT